MAAASPDIVIVGAGVIGCAIAYELAGAGVRVTVLERTQVAAESSSAAAGILAPRLHAHEPALFALALASQDRFRPLVDALADEAGMSVEYAQSGVLELALDENSAEALQDRARWLRADGHDVSWLSPSEAHTLEPGLPPALFGALSDPEAFQVHPLRFTQALATAAARRGVVFESGVEVTGVERRGATVTAVKTTAGARPTGHLVLAAGAWMGVASDWLGFPVPVEPRKGQILSVRTVPTPIRHTLIGADIYLMPRVDGTVVVGGTVERAGFDKSLTADGIGWLLTTIPQVLPALAGAPIERIWAGLRPGTPDDVPIIGRAPSWDNVTLATGHFRSGIMLAPITARLVADLLLHDRRSPLLAPADPGRFSR